jgi:CRP-like cAMP-binding protein
MDALTFLSGHVPLFAGLSEEALSPLAAGSTLKKFGPGQTVLYAGMTVDALHVMALGSASVIAKIPGKGTAEVAKLGTGDVFGEVSMMDRSIAAATIKAGPEGAIVLLVPEEPFRALVAGDASFAARLSTMVESRRRPPAKPAAA